MNERASPAPSMLKALISINKRIPPNTGRKTLATRSMPLAMPATTTPTVSPMKRAAKRSCNEPLPTNAPKKSPAARSSGKPPTLHCSVRRK